MKKAFLLGTPRSGTTYFGHCLDRAGAYIGQLTEFAEDGRICKFHQEIIEDWVSPKPKRTELSPALAHRIEAFADSFKREALAAGKQVWGFKEPRGLLVFHLWCSELDSDSRLLVTFRHPQEFADGCFENWGPGKVWQRDVRLPATAVERDVEYWLRLWVYHWTEFFTTWDEQVKKNPWLKDNTVFLHFSKEWLGENDYLFEKVCRELNLTRTLPSEHFRLEGKVAKHANYPTENMERDIPEGCRPIWARLVELYERQLDGYRM